MFMSDFLNNAVFCCWRDNKHLWIVNWLQHVIDQWLNKCISNLSEVAFGEFISVKQMQCQCLLHNFERLEMTFYQIWNASNQRWNWNEMKSVALNMVERPQKLVRFDYLHWYAQWLMLEAFSLKILNLGQYPLHVSGKVYLVRVEVLSCIMVF